MPLPIVVLVSGRGSNLAAILDAIDRGRCRARVRAVISDRASAQALSLGADRGTPTQVIKLAEFEDRSAWDAALAQAIAAHDPELVVLAGFMRLLGEATVARFENRILNVHPSLLPAFPGKDAPEQAIRARVRISGCTVHVVDRGVDTGPIVAQAAVPVLPDDDAAQLHARIQRAEHALLPAVIDGVAQGRIALGSPIRIDAASLQQDAVLACPALPGKET